MVLSGSYQNNQFYKPKKRYMQLKIKFCMAMALLLCLFSHAYAQSLRVTGKVTAKASGEPLPGASVSVKGTTIGVTTDVVGNYSLNVPKTGVTIVISFIGMKPIETVVTQAGVLNFALEDNANALSEVVVVGYGTQKITTISGAISTVKSEDIHRLNPVRVEEALQGQASGVSVVQSGSPGSGPTILIRGIPSFSGNEPLVVVDGVFQSTADLNAINPEDIESLNVLKDAATLAIYGLKGGNGVVVVTTKTGRKNQKTQLGFTANYGVQQVANTIGVLNGTEYAAIINEGSVVSGGNVIFPNLAAIGVGTDWQKQIFHTAPMQTYSMNATGGSENVTYYLSAGYLSQGGIVGGMDKSLFDRANFTANLNFQLTPKLKFIVNANDVVLYSKGVQENSFNSIIGAALNFDPTVPVLNTVPNTVGKYGFSNNILSEVYNPLTKLDNTYNYNIGNKLYGKFEFQYDVIKGLKLTSRFGYTKYDDNSKTFTPLVFYGPQNVDNTMAADGSTVTGAHNSVSHQKASNFGYSWESFANYDFTVKKNNHFDVTAGFSLQRSSGNADGASRQDVPYNSWDFADFSAATGVNTATNSAAQTGFYYQYFHRNVSYFGRLNYDYDERYLASFSARRDGSSTFGLNKPFANFYAGSLGWVVSKESFFKSDFVNFLKIRGSYGTSGNDNSSPQYRSISTGGPDYGNPVNSNGYNFDNTFYAGSTLATQANDNLAWEVLKQGNAGFDITFYKNKFSVSADVWKKDVSGLLFTPFQSAYVGTIPPPAANIGTTTSKGIDITLSYNETFSKSFRLGNSFSFTASKNLVTATNLDGSAKIPGGGYFNGQSQNVTLFQKGFTPAYFYGYKTQGLFQTQAEIAAAPTQAGAQPGDIRFADVNGDGKIDASDQTKIGDPFPSFTLGWNLTASYKNVDFGMFTYASVGNDVYRAYERNQTYTNKFRSVLGRWTGPGSTNDATTPRYSFLDPNSNIRVSDRYVEDGSFVKIKNIQLGYTFPSSITKKVFKSVRIFGQVKNVYTFTKYSGYDPEISNGGILEVGIDRGAYPQARTYAFGLDIKL